MGMRWILAALAAMCAAGAAQAADKDPCGNGMVCANAPKTVAAALQEAGYKAVLDKDKAGDPMIESAASGYNFTVYFYECVENKDCASLQFIASFDPEDNHTAALANTWNRTKRFSQMSVEDDKTLNFRFDVSTLGGLSEKNFADQIDWWATMLGELSKFFREQPEET